MLRVKAVNVATFLPDCTASVQMVTVIPLKTSINGVKSLLFQYCHKDLNFIWSLLCLDN
jgi:hypothetical protein